MLDYLLKRCDRDPKWAASEIIRLGEKANRTCTWNFVPNKHWETECGITKSVGSELHKFCATCGGIIVGKDVRDSRARTEERMEAFLKVNPQYREDVAEWWWNEE